MAFKFGAVSIYDLGSTISSKLMEDGISKQSELTVYVSKDEFKKIDEDLYYRNKYADDEKDDFIPSEGEIIINFDLVKIYVKEL